MTALSIRGMYRAMDDQEYLRDAMTRQAVPDKRALQNNIASARKAAAVVGFPNTSEPAKERLAGYVSEYIGAYGLLDFANSFEWFRFEKA